MRRWIVSFRLFIFLSLKFLNYLNKTWKFHNPVFISVLISLQDILKTISLAVNEETNGISWERLGGAAKRWISERLSYKDSAILLASLAYISHVSKKIHTTFPPILKKLNQKQVILTETQVSGSSHPVRKWKWKAENRASSNSTSQGF